MAAVIAYAVTAYLLIGGGNEAAELALWWASPLLVPLLVLFFARKRHSRVVALILLASMWAVGAALLLWGLVLNPGDYNHLVVVFLPIHEFIFLAVALPILWLLSFIRFGRRHPG